MGRAHHGPCLGSNGPHICTGTERWPWRREREVGGDWERLAKSGGAPCRRPGLSQRRGRRAAYPQMRVYAGEASFMWLRSRHRRRYYRWKTYICKMASEAANETSIQPCTRADVSCKNTYCLQLIEHVDLVPHAGVSESELKAAHPYPTIRRIHQKFKFQINRLVDKTPSYKLQH